MIKTLKAFKTADLSKKLTSYYLKLDDSFIFLDFGSKDYSIDDLKRADAIFITHEHMDHWLGLLEERFASLIVERKIPIYATKTTIELISYMFEHIVITSFDDNPKQIKLIRKVLRSFIPIHFFEENLISQYQKSVYFTLYPSGHTYGSSALYLKSNDGNLLYTGDFDCDVSDIDRQYDVSTIGKVDYVLADSTNIHIASYKTVNKEAIINRVERSSGYIYAKIEKIPFLAKQICNTADFKDKYLVVYDNDCINYLKIIVKNGYNPFVDDCVALPSQMMDKINKKKIYLTSKRKTATHDRSTPINFVIGLHIYGKEFVYFLQKLYPSYPKILFGHYDYDNVDQLKEFLHFNLSDYEYMLLEEGENEL